MPDAHYDDPALAELYDITCGWSEDRDFYLRLAGDAPKAVLDLGCGTGLLCSAYAAKGHDVTGADPSPAMLDIARRKPHGDRIEWVAAPAQAFRSDRRFDLIVMTGHAFQVLLTDEDIDAGLETMRRHLKPDGRAVFESRNPAIDWVAKWDGELIEYGHNGVPLRQTTEALRQSGNTLAFEQHFHFPNETRVSASILRLSSRAEIEAHLARAGLVVDRLYGDWHEGPFHPASSDEMVFKTRLA